jgi:hypothetical protein
MGGAQSLGDGATVRYNEMSDAGKDAEELDQANKKRGNIPDNQVAGLDTGSAHKITG